MCRFQQLVVVYALVGKPNTLGFGSIQNLTEQHRSHCRLGANDSSQHPCVATTWMNSQLQKSGVKLCASRSNTNVATKCQVHAGPNRCTVYCRDCWQRAASNAKKAFVNDTERFAIGFCQVSKVCSSTKCWRGTRNNDGPNVLVCFDAIHCGNNLGHHWRRHGVALVWVVQGDGGDTVCNIKKDQRHGSRLASTLNTHARSRIYRRH